MDVTELLKRTPLFSALAAPDISYFAKQAQKKRYAKGSELFSAGDRADVFFLIVDGWVKLYRMTREGGEVIINVFAPGETFAEAAVFSPAQRYPVSAQAVEDVTVLEIARSVLVKRMRENGDLALQMLGAVSARQHFLVQQIEQIAAKSAPQRIGIFLLRLCQPGQKKNALVHLPYDKFLVAKRLNIQPETFSRSWARLKAQGVSMKKRDVTISNVQALAEYCDWDDREKLC